MPLLPFFGADKTAAALTEAGLLLGAAARGVRRRSRSAWLTYGRSVVEVLDLLVRPLLSITRKTSQRPVLALYFADSLAAR